MNNNKLILMLMLIAVMLTSFSRVVLSEENSQLPSSPDTGTSEDNSSPGGSRTDFEQQTACQERNVALTSLIGNEIKEFTVSKYPTFWFYIPYIANEIERLEFILEDAQEKQTIYRTPIELSKKAGIIKVAIPQEARYSLKQDKNYTWHLQGYCYRDGNNPDIAISGWINRLAPDLQLQSQLAASKSQKYNIYLQNNIMYDAVTELAEQYQANPKDFQIKNAWIDILKRLGAKDLANKPFVDR
jgi:hypothetical protein